MFCDLVGSTALSVRLDPEDFRDTVRAYQAACAEVIARYDGHVAQYLGDGLLVYFGYPQAHEDDAQRAVRAGLGIVAAIRGLNPGPTAPREPSLSVRVGIHTGLVVVGEVGGGTRLEQLALGETPNLAARLQALAEPDAVVISTATHRLVHGLFLSRDLGPHVLKGVPGPVQAHQILGESSARSRLDVAAPIGLTPLVGREEEVGLLLGRWGRVADGQGQVVVLTGEAGIGKSRLVQVVKERVATQPHIRLECRCSPYYEHSPLYPVIDLLPRVLEWSRDDSADLKLAKLEKVSIRYAMTTTETVSLLASLLSLPASDRFPLPPMSPERQRRRILEILIDLVLAMAAEHPVLLIVEDLHWIDPTTLELLTLLLDQAPTVQVFALLTARPAFQVPWTPRAHLTALTLTRLSRRQTEAMAERVTGGKALPREVIEQIVAKTDGVPLFVEELTKMVLESGLLKEADDRFELTGPLPPLAIPSTLQDSLMARLDRLATVKEVAQLGATLGRAFPYELIRAVAPLDDPTLERALARLVEAELLYQRGVPPRATYTFKHALVQDAAYHSLLVSTRQRHHQRIARVMVERFPAEAETRPEFVAHHYTAAGRPGEAIPFWQAAGRRAVERTAHTEAIAHFTKALAALDHLPDSAGRAQQELTLQIALGAPLIAVKGFAAPEVQKAYGRARELCQQVGETPQLFPVLWGLYAFHLVRAELQTTRDIAEKFLSLAQSVQNSALLVEAHRAVGVTLFYLGELLLAREHLQEGIALYDPHQHRSHAFVYGFDPKVICLSHIGHVLWVLGYPDQALKRSVEAVTLAQGLAHTPSLAQALNYAAMLHYLRQEEQKTQERSEALVALCSEHGFRYWLALGTTWNSWAQTKRGQTEEGLVQMRQGIAASRATGAELAVPFSRALLADAYGRAGYAEEGLALLDDALAAVNETREYWYEAELYRLKGELLLRKAEAGREEAGKEVETCFCQAVEMAHHRSAKSLELRAVMSLSRLWREQGRRAEARQVLAPIYGWFTEGFDTADLKDAKALLDALA